MTLLLQRWLKSVGQHWIPSALVTVLTLVLIGGVVFTTTNLGCGPANQMGLKLARCVSGTNTAARQTPKPLYPQSPPAKGGYYPPVNTPPSTYYPPQSAPATYYPVETPATFYPPVTGNASSGRAPQYPFYPGATGAPYFPALNCTLPVFVGPPGSGGFISYPSGSFTADPRSAVAIPSPGPAQGPGYGYYQSFGMTYDRAHSRWLPVPRQQVSPDGNHYAYTSSTGIYLVDPASGTQVELGEGHQWVVMRALNDRVYATVPNTPGFWVLPFSGAPTEVITTGYWQGASLTAAYGTATSAVPAGSTQALMKLDVATGKTSDWFSQPGATVSVLGFDSQGVPIVQANYNGVWEIWLASSGSSAYVIANSYEGFNTQGLPFADSHGIWLPIWYNPYGQGTQALALFVPGQGLFIIQQISVQLAGGCA